MRLILHNGMPKCGTTALQDTLFENRKLLIKNAILYPAGDSLPRNHNILTAGILSFKVMPRTLKQIYEKNPDQAGVDYGKILASVAKLAGSSKAQVIIISAEELFRKLSPSGAETLRQSLRDIADRLDVITYVRHPADHYLSIVQQSLKASSRISAPVAKRCRPQIESFYVLADNIAVAPYERSSLKDGDITKDFFHRMLPEHNSLTKDMTLKTSNETLSAEGMDILQRYRMHVHPQINNKHTADTNQILSHIRSLDREIEGFSRPRLRQNTHEAVLKSAVDLPWLLDTYGIRFEGVDYEGGFGQAVKHLPPRVVDDICEVNYERRDIMIMQLLKRMMGQDASKRVSFAAALPGKMAR